MLSVADINAIESSMGNCHYGIAVGPCVLCKRPIGGRPGNARRKGEELAVLSPQTELQHNDRAHFRVGRYKNVAIAQLHDVPLRFLDESGPYRSRK
jgi:hypothetical protein